MNNEEIKKVDSLTAAISGLLKGEAPQPVDVSTWESDELRQLGEYYNRLAEEMKKFNEGVEAVSRGDIGGTIRGSLSGASSVKNLQSTLRHLTWQTGQVAGGDFSQRVDFLGDFSRSFNSMVEELASNREKILEKERALELLNSDMKKFLYMVSHDLKVPLVSIKGYLGMISEDYADAFDEDGRTYVGKTLKAVEKMSAMVDALVRLGKIGSLDDARTGVSARKLVEDAMESVKFNAEKRGVKLINDVPDMEIFCYPVQSRMLYENLLNNAVKYIGRDNGAPLVEAGLAERNGVKALYVRDNGIGMDEAAQKYVFEAFKRAPGAETEEGVGIGLATVKKIIENHGGFIELESKPGVGSVFYFSLDGVSSGDNMTGSPQAGT